MNDIQKNEDSHALEAARAMLEDDAANVEPGDAAGALSALYDLTERLLQERADAAKKMVAAGALIEGMTATIEAAHRDVQVMKKGAEYVDQAVHLIQHAMTVASWLQRRYLNASELIEVEPKAFVVVVDQFREWAKARPEAVAAAKRWRERMGTSDV